MSEDGMRRRANHPLRSSLKKSALESSEHVIGWRSAANGIPIDARRALQNCLYVRYLDFNSSGLPQQLHRQDEPGALLLADQDPLEAFERSRSHSDPMAAFEERIGFDQDIPFDCLLNHPNFVFRNAGWLACN